MRAATVLSLVAVALALAASLFWAFGPISTAETCEFTSSGQRTCTTAHESLVESEGAGVVWVLAVPVLLAAALAALVASGSARWLAWVLAVLLLLACLVSAASIGLFYLPAAVVAIVAVAVANSPRSMA